MDDESQRDRRHSSGVPQKTDGVVVIVHDGLLVRANPKGTTMSFFATFNFTVVATKNDKFGTVSDGTSNTLVIGERRTPNK